MPKNKYTYKFDLKNLVNKICTEIENILTKKQNTEESNNGISVKKENELPEKAVEKENKLPEKTVEKINDGISVEKENKLPENTVEKSNNNDNKQKVHVNKPERKTGWEICKLEEVQTVFCENNYDNAKLVKNKILNFEGIERAVKSSKNTLSIRYLQKYITRLENIKNLKFGKIEKEELSEKMANVFWEIFKDEFIDLLKQIIRTEKEDKYSSEEIPKEIKKYLISLNIYTKCNTYTNEGDVFRDKMIDDVDVIAKDSDENINVTDQQIKEIKLLPFEVKYLDDNNEIEKKLIMGKVILERSK